MAYNLGILSVGQVVSQLANMAALVYLAGFLGAYWFGVIQIGVAVMSYCLITAEWGMMSLGIREIARLDDTGRIGRYASQHVALLVFQAAVVLMLGAVVLPRLPFFHHSPLIYLLYMAAVVPQAFMQNWVAVGLEKMTWVGMARILRSLIYAGLIYFVLRHLDGVGGHPAAVWVPALFLTAFALSNLAVNIPLIGWFGRFIPPRPPAWPEAMRRWRETSSIGANIIILRVLYNVDLLLLGILATPEVAGNYAAASRVVFLLMVATEVLWAALLPRLSRLSKLSRDRFLDTFNLYFGGVAAVLLPLAVGGAMLGRPFVAFLYRDRFADAGPIFQILAVAYSLLSLATFLGNTLLAEDRQKWYLLPLVAGSITAVGGVLLMVPRHSGLGAAWAMLAAHGLLFVILVALNARKFRRQIGRLLLQIIPGAACLALVVHATDPWHILWRIALGGLTYLVLAVWPLWRFRRSFASDIRKGPEPAA